MAAKYLLLKRKWTSLPGVARVWESAGVYMAIAKPVQLRYRHNELLLVPF
jgi:hypothetical protein